MADCYEAVMSRTTAKVSLDEAGVLFVLHARLWNGVQGRMIVNDVLGPDQARELARAFVWTALGRLTEYRGGKAIIHFDTDQRQSGYVHRVVVYEGEAVSFDARSCAAMSGALGQAADDWDVLFVMES